MNAEQKEEKRKAFIEELEDAKKTLDIGSDTYAKAFKALHSSAQRNMNLSRTEIYAAFYSALTVYTLQIILLTLIYGVIFGTSTATTIGFASTVQTMAARFICTIMMHLQVEGDERQALRLMKYSINNGDQFRNPGFAFAVGFMQFTGGFLCELACIFYLSTIDTTIDVIIRFIALGSIAKIDDFYAGALPSENKLNNKSGALICANTRADLPFSELSFFQKLGRLAYKAIRIFYASFVFYFLPFLILFIPQIIGDK